MSLSSALGIAQSALANNAAQTALLSKNIANVGNADYSRRIQGAISQVPGGVSLGTAQRAVDASTLAQLLAAQSASTASSALNDGLTKIAATLGLDASSSSDETMATDKSPATLLGALSQALQQYAAQPDNASLAGAAVSAAKAMASTLNGASNAVQAVRTQADTDIASSVVTINSLLAQFKNANDQVVAGYKNGSDTTDAEDTRDGILKQLSNEIGITTSQGSNGSLSIYTDSGATLFETTPRSVTFTATSSYSPDTVGQAVSVDGVPVTGPAAVMGIKSGRLAGLTQLRDGSAVAYQNQLDQIAGTLVTAFSETDQTGGTAPDLPGLFTAPGLTSLPSSAGSVGLAARLMVNANVDPTQGGDVTRLRDGNISAPGNVAYTYNTSGASGYSGRLSQLEAALDQNRSFDASSGGAATGSLAAYATSSVSWLEATRQTASNDATYKSAVVTTTTTALSNTTGVNLDDEMARMLDLEHAYQASAQLMNAVNSMYASLIQAFN